MEELCRQFLVAKQKEAEAKQVRLSLEKQILERADETPLEGTKTLVPGGAFKLTITSKLNRKLDLESYENLLLPDNLRFVDYKPTINLKRLRAIEMVDPDLVHSCVTTKPAKPAIKVVEVTE